MAGRPTKLTPEVQKCLCDALADGNTRQDAAHFAGINVATLKNWITYGRKGHRPYREFLAALRKAESDCACRNAALIQAAAKGTKKQAPDWKAAAWWLERRRRRQFGQNVKAELSGTLRVEVITDADWYARPAAEGHHPAAGHASSNGSAARP